MDTIKKALVELLALVTTVSVLVLAVTFMSSPASARFGDGGGGDDDRIIRTGECDGGGSWKLRVKTDDGRLEVEGEVDVNRAGQQWAWTIRHNGSVSARGTATTNTRSGSFSVERKIVDLAGTDRVVFRATRQGRACRGVVNY